MAISDADPVLLDGTTYWENFEGWTSPNATGFYPITFLVGFVVPNLAGALKLGSQSDGTANHYMRLQTSSESGGVFNFSVDTDAGAGGNEGIYTATDLADDTAHLIMVSITNNTTWLASRNGSTEVMTGTLRTTTNVMDSIHIAAERSFGAFNGTYACFGVWGSASITQTEMNNVTGGTTSPLEINATMDAAIEYLVGFEGTTLTAYAGSAGDFTQTGTGITEPGTYDSAFEALG